MWGAVIPQWTLTYFSGHQQAQIFQLINVIALINFHIIPEQKGVTQHNIIVDYLILIHTDCIVRT